MQSSDYAELLGVPVAAFGVVGYLLIAALAAFGSPRARGATAAVALGAAVFSGYLLVVQLAVIDAVCDWCVANDVISSLVAVLALARLLQPAICGSCVGRTWTDAEASNPAAGRAALRRARSARARPGCRAGASA